MVRGFYACSSAMTYRQRLSERISRIGSRLCVGLDPRPGSASILDTEKLLRQVIEETAEYAAAFKPNMAYFEAMGLDGIKLLDSILPSISKDVPIILDAKRSDIGETQKYYAQSYFQHWNVDAVTLNPFLGYDSIEPFLSWAGKGIYLLAVTSNAGSADFQRKALADGRQVFELVTELGNRAADSLTSVGYVVGLTNAGDVLSKIPDAPLLIPGLGAQGGDLSALAQAKRSAPDVVNVSRGIMYASDEKSFQQRAIEWRDKIAAAGV